MKKVFLLLFRKTKEDSSFPATGYRREDSMFVFEKSTKKLLRLPASAFGPIPGCRQAVVQRLRT